MRYLMIILTSALIFSACGDDTPYEPDPPPERAIHIVPPRAMVDLSDFLQLDARNIYEASVIVFWKVEDIL